MQVSEEFKVGNFSYVTSAEPRAVDDEVNNVLIIITKSPAPIGNAIFDAVRRPLDFTRGQGFHFAYFKAKNTEEYTQFLDEFDAALKKFERDAMTKVNGTFDLSRRKPQSPEKGD